jgi:hypothetical protein
VEIFRDADDGRYRVRMLVGGDVTERILADAHRMGFADARVLTD